MASANEVKLFNPGEDCRGKPCDNAIACLASGGCQYKSSSDEARVRLRAQLDRCCDGGGCSLCNPRFMEQSDKCCSGSSADEARERIERMAESYSDVLTAVRDAEITGELKPTNPKDAIGSDKIPMHLWPETATVLGALGLLDGALKYGRSNFREIGVRASIYVDAAKRHLNAYFEGEDADPDSGLPHLAHALACLAILVDADAAGKLNDDRNVRGGYRGLIDKLTPHVKRLKALHASKSPKHYTIADNR